MLYDPAMHGVDWGAVRRKYEAVLPAVADRSDLNFVMGELLAELNRLAVDGVHGATPASPSTP